jgi:cation:H+ antiporter
MPPVISTLTLFLGSAVLIYLACEYFVNGVEWAGHRFDFGQNATGTILAAFGTALPESVVTFVAVVFGKSPAQKEIGIGAALGGPLVLGTIAYAVVGWTLLASRRGRQRFAPLDVDYSHLSRDQAWFLVIFAGKIALGLLVFGAKSWCGLAFLAAYTAYFWKETRARRDEAEGALEPLRIRPRDTRPSTGWVLLQTLAAMSLIFGACRVFVNQLIVLGPVTGLSPQVVALLFSPIATELPEILNAVIWVRQRKERLALANVSGAMMIQATVPTAFGLFFTPWILSRALLFAAGVTATSVLALCLFFRRGKVAPGKLSLFAFFYLLFALILAGGRP